MKQDRPIVPDRMHKDWYFVTVGFFAWLRHRNVNVRFKFYNRSKHIVLGKCIDIGRLREEIAHVAKMEHTDEDIQWYWDNYGEDKLNGFLTMEYLNWLRTSKLSPIDIEKIHTPSGTSFSIEPHGLWMEAMDWETFILPIITYLYGEWVLKEHGFTREQAHAEAMFRHGMLVERLRPYPDLRIGSFGLRRQFDYELSRKIDEVTIREIPNQLAGISCVGLAKQLGQRTIGTFPHLGPMIYAGICEDTDEAIRASHMQFFDDWADTFPEKYRTAVIDTFGSDSFFQDFGPERIKRWPRFKIDSGNPFHESDKIEAWLKSYGVNPRTKVVNPTDGLNGDLMIALHLALRHRFESMLPGIGTNWTNNTGLPTYGSFVVKADEANGRKLVKLSNNLDKASGDPAMVARMKRIHGYTNTERAELIV